MRASKLLVTATTLALSCAMLGMVVTSDASASSRTQGVRGHTVTVGAFAPLTGPAVEFSEVSKAARAEIDYVNAHGGVHGYKIKLDVLTDGYQSSIALTDTKKLVEEDHVFAVVTATGTSTNEAIEPYLIKNGVPNIGFGAESGFAAKYPASAHIYGFIAPYADVAANMVRYLAHARHAKKISFAYQNTSVGTAARPGVQYEAKKASVDVVGTVPIPVTTTNFSGYATRLKSEDAPVVYAWMPVTEFIGLVKACVAIGYDPTWAGPDIEFNPSVVSALGKTANGMIFDQWFPTITSSTAGAKTVRRALIRYTSDKHPTDTAILGWIGMGTFISALKAATAHGKTPTRARIESFLSSGKSFDPGSLGYSLKYGHDNIPKDVDSIGKVENGKLVTVQSGRRMPVVPRKLLS